MTNDPASKSLDSTRDERALQAWVGRTRSIEVLVDAETARRMSFTLDLDAAPAEGEALPPLWHWLYQAEPVPTGELGEDGHARLGDFLPPVALHRRMWAGGRIRFAAPIVIGARIRRTSTVRRVVRKSGRSGELCFVTVEHLISPVGSDVPLLVEEHDIVYREAASGEPAVLPRHSSRSVVAASVPLEDIDPTHRRVNPSVSLLMRYSALTFNTHRIHYDRGWCREVEGYPALVFHGPLTATLLAGFALERAERGQTGHLDRAGHAEPAGREMASFEFQARSPLFDDAPFELVIDRSAESLLELSAIGPAGDVSMKATARFRERSAAPSRLIS